MKQAESIVLVPGLMCDASCWRQQVAMLGADREIKVAEHALSDTLQVMAERILDEAAPRFALAGHSMGGRVALEVMAQAPDRVSRLALLDTGYQALAAGEAGDREKAGRYRLLEIAQRDGMLPMRVAQVAAPADAGAVWSRTMERPQAVTEAMLAWLGRGV